MAKDFVGVCWSVRVCWSVACTGNAPVWNWSIYFWGFFASLLSFSLKEWHGFHFSAPTFATRMPRERSQDGVQDAPSLPFKGTMTNCLILKCQITCYSSWHFWTAATTGFDHLRRNTSQIYGLTSRLHIMACVMFLCIDIRTYVFRTESLSRFH